MPSWIHPVDKFEIDWADDGYMHPLANVYNDMYQYYFRYGAETDTNPGSIRLINATGSIQLRNDEGKFDPGSTDRGITSTALRKPHKCRLVDGTTVLWEGWAVPTQNRTLLSEDLVEFELNSLWYTSHNDEKKVTNNTDITLAAFLTANGSTVYDSTLSRLIAAQEIGKVLSLIHI